MKSLMRLVSCTLADAGVLCATDTQADYREIARRVEHEGISFLTITLPGFAKEFERALERGHVDPTQFSNPPFKKTGTRRNRGLLPKFLQGVVSQVFDTKSGELLPVPSIDAILAVRQICLMFKKVQLPCSTEREETAYAKYLECDSEVGRSQMELSSSDISAFARLSGCMWSGVLSALSRKIESGGIVGRHGPGATAERIAGNRKFELRTWHHRLQPFFPFDQFGIANLNWLEGDSGLDGVDFLEPVDEPPARVVAVPKTLKGPRIIAIEPVCMQYAQQSLLEPLVEILETSEIASGHVNFRSQETNRILALQASKDGYFATLDLSEASDRVSLALVTEMLRTAPDVLGAVLACRSRVAELPTGHRVVLRKFASMGSALCFPIESMVFYTLCTLARLRALNLPLTPRNALKASRGVYVYGDDLIVPANEVAEVIKTLEAFGLKVNSDKSFWAGRFRESCGMDAFAGEEVTPTYLRRMLPDRFDDVPEIVSAVATANQLYLKGWWQTARYVRQLVDSVVAERLRRGLPTVGRDAPCLGWYTYRCGYDVQGWDSDLQKPLVRSLVVTPKSKPDPLEGHGALMKFFLKRGQQITERKHLERVVRPGSATLKSRWASPF